MPRAVIRARLKTVFVHTSNVSLSQTKGVTAYTQLRRCVMKFYQIDKISTCSCTFDEAVVQCKNIRRIYGRIAGNQLPGHVPL